MTMQNKFCLAILACAALLLSGCEPTENEAEQTQPSASPEPAAAVSVVTPEPTPAASPVAAAPAATPKPTPVATPEPKPSATPAPTVAAPKPSSTPQPTPVAATPEPAATDDEYIRSISEMEGSASVSREDFEEDKRKILKIIEQLADIMKDYDYDKWLAFIEPASVTYWQNSRNLSNASKLLPVSVRTQLPGQRLRTLRDYFSHVFIPSRQDRLVDEIRYISPTDVKAVQTTSDSDIIFYYFTKNNGQWLVHLPPVEK